MIGNIGIPWDKGLSMSISEIAVPLAIPLILFSLDLKKWLSLAKKTITVFCADDSIGRRRRDNCGIYFLRRTGGRLENTGDAHRLLYGRDPQPHGDRHGA